MIEVRHATDRDVDAIETTHQEVSAWLDAACMPMCVDKELSCERIAQEVSDGLFPFASVNGEVAGTVRFQLDDQEFWPDLPPGHGSAFIHRLAVRRASARQGVSKALLAWSANHARALGRKYLRLDCDANRAALRRLYEGFGFQYHSSRQVGPYFVARYELRLTP